MLLKICDKVIEWGFYLLFFLIPLAWYSGSHELFEYNKMMLTYGLTIIIVAAWLVKMIDSGKFIYKRTFLEIPLFLYLGSHILSTIFSIDAHVSIWGYYSRFHEGLLGTISYIILYFAAVSNLQRLHVLRILRVSLVSAAIVAVYGIFEHFGHSLSCLFVTGNFDVDCWVQDVKNRVYATLGQPNWMAAYLDVIILFLIGILFQNTQKTQSTGNPEKSDRSEILKGRFFDFLSSPSLLKIGLLMIFFFALLFTKSRSGFLGLAAGVAVFIILTIKKQWRLPLTILATVAGITILIFTLNRPGTASFNGEISESGDIRKVVWSGAIKVWQRYPILGSGVETFAYSYYQDRPVEHNMLSEWDFLYNKAHNEFLNILATTGTVGILTYLALIGSSLWLIKKNPSLLAAYVSILVTNFFGFSVVIIGLYFFLIPAFYEILSD